MFRNNHTTEEHFILMVKLMLGFFIVYQGLEIVNAMSWIPNPLNTDPAHEAFKAFFFIAIGIFRGMLPTNGKSVSGPSYNPKTGERNGNLEKDR